MSSEEESIKEIAFLDGLNKKTRYLSNADEAYHYENGVRARENFFFYDSTSDPDKHSNDIDENGARAIAILLIFILCAAMFSVYAMGILALSSFPSSYIYKMLRLPNTMLAFHLPTIIISIIPFYIIFRYKFLRILYFICMNAFLAWLASKEVEIFPAKIAVFLIVFYFTTLFAWIMGKKNWTYPFYWLKNKMKR